MRLGVDIDGVLSDYNTSAIHEFVTVTGADRFPDRPFDIPCWNYFEYYGYSKEEIRAAIASINKRDDFWVNLGAYPGTLEVMSDLAKLRALGHQIYFVTDRGGETAKLQTERWLSAYGMYNPTVLISKHKGLCASALELDCYIDDKDVNVLDVKAHRPECRVYLRDQPWNRTNSMLNFDIQEGKITRVPDAQSMLDMECKAYAAQGV